VTLKSGINGLGSGRVKYRMKIVGKTFILVLGLLLPGSLMIAQTAETIISATAEAQGLSWVATPPSWGTFWTIHPGESDIFLVPLPCPPSDPSTPVFAIADGQFLADETAGDLGASLALMEDQSNAVINLIARVQIAAAGPQLRRMGLADGSPLFPGDGSGGSESDVTNISRSFTPNTNELWLMITNATRGVVDLNLYVPTNLIHTADQVYAIWTTTNLLSGWEVEKEVWLPDPLPTTNPVVIPFTLSASSQSNLFVRAENWTGVTENGNITPDWWFWEYFHTTELSDTNLDSEGNTLLSDYLSAQDPNVINFSLNTTNDYFNTVSVPGQLNLASGMPGYIAVSIDDTNYANDATWQPYTGTNFNIMLGVTQGWHNVAVGLKGVATNSYVTWELERLNMDLIPPLIVITNPMPGTVAVPWIELQGYSPEALASISYDLTNGLGTVTNRQVLIMDQFYSATTWEITTNTFEAFDVPLTNGLNVITIHATDLAGNVTTTNFNFTLDYSNKPPPNVTIYWPQNGANVSGNSFNLTGNINDQTAVVSTQLIFTNGDTNIYADGIITNIYSGTVGWNGDFSVQNLPLNAGSNAFALTITDAAGNIVTTNLTVIQSSLQLTINPVQAGQTTVTGTINSTNYTVWANGVIATLSNGTNWSALISAIGMGGGAVNVIAIPNIDNGGYGSFGTKGGGQ
jgi:hypothetical protein